MALIVDKTKCPVGMYDTVAKVCIQDNFNDPVDFEMEEIAVNAPNAPMAPVVVPRGVKIGSLVVLGLGALTLWYVTKELSK